MLYFTKGYDQSLEEALNGAIFDEDHDESMCAITEREREVNF
jgi:hypothetical protein